MKPKRKIIQRNGKSYTVRGVELTRCSKTKTEAEFWSMIRSLLRSGSQRWKPRSDYLLQHRRNYRGKDKRLKFEYQCELCQKWYKRKEVELDHIIPCGSLTSWDEMAEFAKRLFIEVDEGWRIVCKPCHRIKTLAERRNEKK